MTQKVLLDVSPHTIFVDAEIVGAFAVHPDINQRDRIFPDEWQVSHLFTGLLISGGGLVNEFEARQLAHELMTLPIDWYFGGASFEDGHAAAKPIAGPFLAKRRAVLS